MFRFFFSPIETLTNGIHDRIVAQKHTFLPLAFIKSAEIMTHHWLGCIPLFRDLEMIMACQRSWYKSFRGSVPRPQLQPQAFSLWVMWFQQAATDIFLGTNDSLFRIRTIRLFFCFDNFLFQHWKIKRVISHVHWHVHVAFYGTGAFSLQSLTLIKPILHMFNLTKSKPINTLP